jgi:hypothetical protein
VPNNPPLPKGFYFDGSDMAITPEALLTFGERRRIGGLRPPKFKLRRELDARAPRT